MAEEKERCIGASVSNDEDNMDESHVGSSNATGDIRNIECDELGISDSADEEPGTEPEHDAWAGRAPLSQSLSAWSVARERERLVIVCIMKHFNQ